jgi:hemoglobin-like flavoprotein
VAQALLWTLERGLGDAFTPATREAWAQAYGILADVMKGASAPVADLPHSVRAARETALAAD